MAMDWVSGLEVKRLQREYLRHCPFSLHRGLRSPAARILPLHFHRFPLPQGVNFRVARGSVSDVA